MRDVRRHPLTRRAFLRGAGAAMALPFLEQLAPAAHSGGAAKPPLRFGVFTVVTGGTVIESWKPKETSPLGKLVVDLAPRWNSPRTIYWCCPACATTVAARG